MSTKHFMQIMVLVATIATFGSAPVLAQEKGHGKAVVWAEWDSSAE